MKHSGYTEDGKVVMGGLFKLHDEQGVPLTLSLMFLKNKDMVPDLGGFVNDALDNGWTFNAAVQRIREAIIDIHGKARWLQIEPRLEQVLELRVRLKYRTNNSV